jgi:RHS repeat-associated protein
LHRDVSGIDEVVMIRVKDEGELYVHQAEGDQGGSPKDWNVVGLTDLGGRLVERYVYRPYGEVTVHQLGGYADYDGDGDVDANDRGEITGLTCGGSNPSGACRVLDLDFDNDCDSSDETVFDALPHTGTVIHPARRSSLLGQPFAHQGLLLDSEIASYQNRARQYGPGLRRFVQRDPLAERSLGFGFGYAAGGDTTVREVGALIELDRLLAYFGNSCERLCDRIVDDCTSNCGDDLPCAMCSQMDSMCTGFCEKTRFRHWDLYLYDGANPARYVDPTGLVEWDCGRDDPDTFGNGCGGLGLQRLLNRPFGCNFKPCCDKHDRCYGCCRTPPQTRGECETNFRSCLHRASGWNPVCHIIATTYHLATGLFGGFFYNGCGGST